MAGVRQVLFDLHKEIIDDEWGPYEDAHYWEKVDAAVARLGLTREWGVERPGRSDGSPVWRTGEQWCRERVAFLNDRYGPGEARLVSRWVSGGEAAV